MLYCNRVASAYPGSARTELLQDFIPADHPRKVITVEMKIGGPSFERYCRALWRSPPYTVIWCSLRSVRTRVLVQVWPCAVACQHLDAAISPSGI